jgi:hypothetical protein
MTMICAVRKALLANKKNRFAEGRVTAALYSPQAEGLSAS